MSKETISQTEGLCKEVAMCVRNAYEKGLNDAWECARKIMLSDEDGGIAHIDIQKIFGGSYYQAMMNYSASEVIDKLKEYEEKKKADTIQQERDCEHCSKVYGTLGCCTTVSNEWVYSCEEGHKQYAERHKADDEIKVGDEVYIVMENYPSVVTCIFSESGLDNPKAVHITQSGKYAVTPLSQLHKTGRHFDQIVEILEQLKEAQDEDNTSAG